jgi:hypothetical protein
MEKAFLYLPGFFLRTLMTSYHPPNKHAPILLIELSQEGFAPTLYLFQQSFGNKTVLDTTKKKTKKVTFSQLLNTNC